jgi:O-antigen ligase
MIVQLFTIYIENNKDFLRILKTFLVVGFVIGIGTLVSKFYVLEYIYPLSQQVSLMSRYGGDFITSFSDKGLHFKILSIHEQQISGNAIKAGGFLDGESASFVLNFIIFILLSFLFTNDNRRKKIMYFCLLFFMFVATILTGSKGGFISLVVGLMFALSLNPALRARRVSWFVFIIILFVCAISFNYFVFGEGRIVGFFIDRGAYKINVISYTSRMDIWERGFNEFYETYGIGLGAGTSALVAKTLPHMHSYYFSALFDAGLIGLIIYMGIIARIFLELIRKILLCNDIFLKNTLCNMFAALVTASFNGLTSSEYNATLYWIIIGLVVAITTHTNFIRIKAQNNYLGKITLYE